MAGRQGWQPTKEMACRECGEPQTVNAQKVIPPLCALCAALVCAKAIREMHEKSGQTYRAWLDAGGANGRPKGRRRGIPTNAG